MGYGCLTTTRWNPFIGFSVHDAMVPNPALIPPVLPVKYWPHINFGLASGTHLMSYWTDRKGQEIQLDGVHWLGRGSDASLVVPHVDLILGFNPLLPWNILFGGSISIWGTSGVTIMTTNPLFGRTKCDLACSPFKNTYMTLNLSCFSPISLPTDITICWGTAKAGFTLADLWACLADIALEIAMDLIMKFGGDVLGAIFKPVFSAVGGLFKKGAKEVAAGVAAKALEEAAEEAGQAALKKAAKEVAAEAAEEAVEKAAKEAAEEVVEKAAKEVAAGAAEEATEKAAKEAAEEVAEKAAKEASAEAVEETAEKAAKEAAESTASKTGKEAAAGFAESLDALRKEADDVLEAVIEEASEEAAGSGWKRTFKESWEGLSSGVGSALDDAGAALKKAAKEASAGAQQLASAAAAKRKAYMAAMLDNGDMFSSFVYIELKKGGKYTRKVVSRAIAVAQGGSDKDSSAASFSLGPIDLGDREDVTGDYGDESDSDVEVDTSIGVSARFVWTDEAYGTVASKSRSRFAWTDEAHGTVATDDVADRFAWRVEAEADAG